MLLSFSSEHPGGLPNLGQDLLLRGIHAAQSLCKSIPGDTMAFCL